MALAVEWVYTKPGGVLQGGFRVSLKLLRRVGDIGAAVWLRPGYAPESADRFAGKTGSPATFDKFYRSNAKFPDIALDPFGGHV